jgi:cyclic-di-GMP phosphodiesterase TipF (flagellum assembly factor)
MPPIERKHAGGARRESPRPGTAGQSQAELRMGRLSAIFVAICMILIAGAIGAVLYLRFGLSGAEATLIGIAILTGLALFNAVTTRQRDSGEVGSQIADLSRLTAEVSRQITELSRRVATIEGKAQAAVETTLAATEPINAEIGEVGGLIKQIAETVAAHDSQLKVLSPSALAPGAAADALPAVVSTESALAPLVAGLPAEDAAAPAAEIAPVVPPVAEPKLAEAKPAEPKPVETKPADTKPAGAISAIAKPVEPTPEVKPAAIVAEAKPPEVKAVEVKPAEPKAAEPKPIPLQASPAPWVPAPAVLKPAEPSPFGLKLGEPRPLEPKPLEAKPLEPRPAAPPVELASGRAVGGRFKDMEPAAAIQMVREAVDANRIDLFLQPIVTLPQRKVRYYEAVARLRAADGEQLMAADFLPFAEAGGLMPKIDNMMLFRCVQVVRRLLAKNREIGLFCNISGSTLVDALTFPQFAEFMEANKAIAPALVFEFTQAALRAMGPIENESLAALAQRGYRFSLDNVTDLRIEPRDLAERGFRFVKVQAPLLLNRSGIAVSDIHPQDFAGLLSRFGVELIAAKIESESAVVDLLDYDVKFGQGFLFSPPRPVRPEVMQGISGDVVVREGEAPTPTPAQTPLASAGGSAPPVAHRLTSLAQLARGVVARN